MYSRFTTLQEHSKEDQKRIENSTAAVVGLGATGSAIAENLARHGINLILIDRDYLEEKDTYSSSIYTPKQCQKSLPKTKAAEENLNEITNVQVKNISLKPGNIDLLSSADIILDGTDNIQTRQTINDYSQKTQTPWIYTAAIAEKAYSMPFIDKCFNCIIQKPDKIATCETDGIMRETAQIAAAKSSKKSIKILTNKEIEQKLEIIHKETKLGVENKGCKICRGESYPHLEPKNNIVAVCGSGKYQLTRDFDLDSLDSLPGQKIAENKYLVRIRYEGRNIALFDSGRIIVEAEDEGHAEATVSEILGI
jgi:adenylyltransferase/sulfurtransferase